MTSCFGRTIALLVVGFLSFVGTVLAQEQNAEVRQLEVMEFKQPSPFGDVTLILAPEDEMFADMALAYEGKIIWNSGGTMYPETEGTVLTNKPDAGCSMLAVESFSGGAHCCFETALLTFCPEKKILSVCGTSDTPLSLPMEGDSIMEAYDWAFAYYEAGDSLFIPFAMSNPVPRILVYDETGWRPDEIGEYQSRHNEWMLDAIESASQYTEYEEGQASYAIVAGYHALMTGQTPDEVQQLLNRTLPDSWVPVSDKILVDIMENQASFSPCENVPL